MKKYILYLIALLLIPIAGWGQYYANIPTYPQTPEAASLSKFGDIPVGHYTGVPNIEIPLYTIEQDGVKIPISLRYHSSGIKIDEIASRVGLGWSLDTGGNITRRVYGTYDKDFTPELPINFRPNGIPERSNKHLAIATQALGLEADFFGHDHIKDLQPDVYSYNLLGKSGRFIFNSNQTINKIPYSNITIKSESFHNRSISITNTSGIKVFYSALNKNEYLPFVAHPTYFTNDKIPNLWTPDEIILPNQSKIQYQYKNKFKYDLITSVSEAEKVGIYYHFGAGTVYDLPKIDYSAISLFENPVSEIIFTQGKVVFIYAESEREDLPGDHYLKEIKIFDIFNQLMKHYMFSYTYFTSIESPPYNFFHPFNNDESKQSLLKRLKLNSISEILSNSVYSFIYYEDKPIPCRLSPNKDHWGLANGTYNNSLLPKVKWMEKQHIEGELGLKILGSANKKPNLEYAKLGTIKSITYPTGGKTEFIFELDDYHFEGKEVVNEVVMSKTVHNQKTQDTFILTADDWNVSMEFYNGIDNSSDPIIAPSIDKSYGVLLDERGNEIVSKMFSSQTLSLNNLSLNRDYNTNKTYRIRVNPEENYHGIGDWQEPSIALSVRWLRTNYKQVSKNKTVGSLRIKDIKNYDTNGTLLSHKSYSYVDPEKGFSSAKKLELDPSYVSLYRTYIASGLSDGHTYYSVFRSSPVNEINIEGGKPVGYEHVTETTISSQTSYTSQYKFYVKDNKYHPDNTYSFPPIPTPEDIGIFTGFGSLLEEKNNNNQGGSLYKKEFNYLIDNKYNFHPNLNQGISITYKIERGLHGLPHYIFDWSYYKIHNSWLKLLQEKTTEYFYEGANQKSLTTQKDYTYSPDYKHLQPVSINTTTSTGGELITKYQYPPDLAESNTLMKSLTDQNRIGTPVTTEVIRKENGTEKQLSYTQTDYAQDTSTSSLVLPKYVYAKKGEASLEKKITYDKYDSKGNLLQYTPESGLPVSLIWGYNNQYPVAKIEGANYAEVESYVTNLQNLSNSNNQSGLLSAFSDLRAKLPQAMITTYTYQPLVGVTTITAPNGLTEYYTYDSAGRLKEIKDQDGKLLKSFEYKYKTQN